MKNLIATISLCFLAGCSTFSGSSRTETAVEYRTAERSAPAELYDIPPYPQLLINKSTKQSDVAQWIIDLEEYATILEGKIKALKEFFETQPEVK